MWMYFLFESLYIFFFKYFPCIPRQQQRYPLGHKDPWLRITVFTWQLSKDKYKYKRTRSLSCCGRINQESAVMPQHFVEFVTFYKFKPWSPYLSLLSCHLECKVSVCGRSTALQYQMDSCLHCWWQVGSCRNKSWRFLWRHLKIHRVKNNQLQPSISLQWDTLESDILIWVITV